MKKLSAALAALTAMGAVVIGDGSMPPQAKAAKAAKPTGTQIADRDLRLKLQANRKKPQHVEVFTRQRRRAEERQRDKGSPALSKNGVFHYV